MLQHRNSDVFQTNEITLIMWVSPITTILQWCNSILLDKWGRTQCTIWASADMEYEV